MSDLGANRSLPADFGKDWMTANASDMAKIAVALGGFDRDELVRRLCFAPSRGEKINLGTVERVLGEMDDEVGAVVEQVGG